MARRGSNILGKGLPLAIILACHAQAALAQTPSATEREQALTWPRDERFKAFDEHMANFAAQNEIPDLPDRLQGMRSANIAYERLGLQVTPHEALVHYARDKASRPEFSQYPLARHFEQSGDDKYDEFIHDHKLMQHLQAETAAYQRNPEAQKRKYEAFKLQQERQQQRQEAMAHERQMYSPHVPEKGDYKGAGKWNSFDNARRRDRMIWNNAWYDRNEQYEVKPRVKEYGRADSVQIPPFAPGEDPWQVKEPWKEDLNSRHPSKAPFLRLAEHRLAYEQEPRPDERHTSTTALGEKHSNAELREKPMLRTQSFKLHDHYRGKPGMTEDSLYRTSSWAGDSDGRWAGGPDGSAKSSLIDRPGQVGVRMTKPSDVRIAEGSAALQSEEAERARKQFAEDHAMLPSTLRALQLGESEGGARPLSKKERRQRNREQNNASPTLDFIEGPSSSSVQQATSSKKGQSKSKSKGKGKGKGKKPSTAGTPQDSQDEYARLREDLQREAAEKQQQKEAQPHAQEGAEAGGQSGDVQGTSNSQAGSHPPRKGAYLEAVLRRKDPRAS